MIFVLIFLVLLILLFLVFRSLSIMTLEVMGAGIGLIIVLIAYFVNRRKRN